MVPRDYNPEDFFTNSDASSDPTMYDGNHDKIKVLKKRCKKRKRSEKASEDAKFLRYLSQAQIDILRDVEKKCDGSLKRKSEKPDMDPISKRPKRIYDGDVCEAVNDDATE